MSESLNHNDEPHFAPLCASVEHQPQSTGEAPCELAGPSAGPPPLLWLLLIPGLGEADAPSALLNLATSAECMVCRMHGTNHR